MSYRFATQIKNNQIVDSIRQANNERKGRCTDRIEDYLEIVYMLIQLKGYATNIDISECLNVSAPGVSKMMQRLHTAGYLKYEKYRDIRLTEQGEKIAINIQKTHELLTEFFKMIGVREDIANFDAEGITHHLHSETMQRLEEKGHLNHEEWEKRIQKKLHE